MALKDYEEFLVHIDGITTTTDNKENPLLKNWELIDSIDLLPYIEKYENLSDLIWALECIYDNSEYTSNTYCQNNLFNWIDSFEFSRFIRSKYNINYREEVVTNYIRDPIET